MLLKLSPDIFIIPSMHRGDVYVSAGEAASLGGYSPENGSTWIRNNVGPQALVNLPVDANNPAKNGRRPLMVGLADAILGMMGGVTTRNGKGYSKELIDFRFYASAVLATVATDGIYVDPDLTVEGIDAAIELLESARALRAHRDKTPSLDTEVYKPTGPSSLGIRIASPVELADLTAVEAC